MLIQRKKILWGWWHFILNIWLHLVMSAGNFKTYPGLPFKDFCQSKSRELKRYQLKKKMFKLTYLTIFTDRIEIRNIHNEHWFASAFCRHFHFPFKREKVRTSPVNRVINPCNQEKQSFGEGIVLQKKQNANKVFVEKGQTINKTLKEREFPERCWSPLNVGEIFIQEKNKAIEDEIAENTRKACFRVHIVKNTR